MRWGRALLTVPQPQPERPRRLAVSAQEPRVTSCLSSVGHTPSGQTEMMPLAQEQLRASSQFRSILWKE